MHHPVIYPSNLLHCCANRLLACTAFIPFTLNSLFSLSNQVLSARCPVSVVHCPLSIVQCIHLLVIDRYFVLLICCKHTTFIDLLFSCFLVSLCFQFYCFVYSTLFAFGFIWFMFFFLFLFLFQFHCCLCTYFLLELVEHPAAHTNCFHAYWRGINSIEHTLQQCFIIVSLSFVHLLCLSDWLTVCGFFVRKSESSNV